MEDPEVPPSSRDIPALLRAGATDNAAAEEPFARLYRELHRLAEHQLTRQGGALTLGATTLVHEVFLSMVGRI